jgi:glutathione peroxidase
MLRTLTIVALVLACGAISKADPAAPTTQPVAPVLNFTMRSLEGQDIPLSRYQGKVILMVNVASHCGHTPQYKPLEALYTKYGPQGFMILGFPANDFKQQEPGTDAEISEFCKKNYGVTFDMFSKVVVKGDGQCDLYKFLTSADTNPKFPGDITWNFEKFIIGRNGQIVNRFSPKIEPDAPEVISAIEAEIAKTQATN